VKVFDTLAIPTKLKKLKMEKEQRGSIL